MNRLLKRLSPHVREATRRVVAGDRLGLGERLIGWLSREPTPLPGSAQGIVVLAGDPGRLDLLPPLLLRYPHARVIFSGGAGPTVRGEPHLREGARRRAQELGLDPATLEWESASRNTHENARFALRLAGEDARRGTWLLVTDDWHLLRAEACFRAEGWPMVVGVPRRAHDPTPGWAAEVAVRELVAVVTYRLRGLTGS